MGVLVEGFKRDRIMIFPRSFARVMKLDQVSRRERFICNWVGVIMLPVYCEELCGLRKVGPTSAKE